MINADTTVFYENTVISSRANTHSTTIVLTKTSKGNLIYILKLAMNLESLGIKPIVTLVFLLL